MVAGTIVLVESVRTRVLHRPIETTRTSQELAKDEPVKSLVILTIDAIARCW